MSLFDLHVLLLTLRLSSWYDHFLNVSLFFFNLTAQWIFHLNSTTQFSQARLSDCMSSVLYQMVCCRLIEGGTGLVDDSPLFPSSPHTDKSILIMSISFLTSHHAPLNLTFKTETSVTIALYTIGAWRGVYKDSDFIRSRSLYIIVS
jgi:hypothetical protein